MFTSSVTTRARSASGKDTEPKPIANPKPRQKRRSPEEIQEDDRQKQKDAEDAEAETQRNIKAIGEVEDNLRKEDLLRRVPHNRRLENVAPFAPEEGKYRP